MGIESIIGLLINICLLVLVIYLVIWVLGQLGLALPAQVVKILWVIVVLVVVLMLVRAIVPLRFVGIGPPPSLALTAALVLK